MPAPADLVATLAAHQGAARGVRADDLAQRMGVTVRTVRLLVSAARREGAAVCAHPMTGYYLAQSAGEIERCCAFLRSRAMHSLTLEARLRKLPLPELLGQLRLPEITEGRAPATQHE